MFVLPHITPGEALAVSATLYTTYRKCPEQALGRLRGQYPAESRASFRGGLAHRVFARHLEEGPIAEVGIEQVCREEIGKSLNPKVATLGLKPSELRGLIREVADLYERFKRLSADGFQAAEVFLEVEPANGVILRGSIDAVFEDGDKGVRLTDWKTGGMGAAEDQLAFYAMLWAMAHGELPGAVEAVSIATGERFTAVPTREQAEATALEVAHLVSAVRVALAAGDDLERSGGAWCRYCPLLDECAEGAAAVAVFSA